jgi:ketosteroid isomerase-like protein
MRRRTLVLVSAVVVSLLGGAVAGAQEATPEPPRQLIIPAANQCTVTPRDIAFFEQFAVEAMTGTPVAPPMAATPVDPETFVMPEGEPPDRATQREVLDTIRKVAACLNAGNTLAFYALYTDDFFFGVAAIEGPLTEEDLAALAAEPTPLPAGGQAAIIAIHEVRVLPDGRVAALVDLLHPFADPPGPTRILFLLEEQPDGRWLIDEEIVIGAVEG